MIETIYRRAVIPYFESQLKRRKTFQYWAMLEKSQWWSRDRLQQWQFSRLRRLLRYCRKNSPFYREMWANRGLTLDDLKTLDDFRRWPVTSRETMRDHAERIRTAEFGLPVVRKSTGGSSGMPLHFVIDTDANDRRGAVAHRGYAWAGALPGTKQAHLWGGNLAETPRWKKWKERLYHRGLYRRDVLNSFRLTEEAVPWFVQRLNRFRPKVVVAYTNPLYALARSIEQRQLAVHRPQAIIIGAEKLHAFQRSLIERVFEAPVFETYGSREFTLIGAECEQRSGLHLSMESLIVEVVDEEGNSAPPGQEGQIVITDLFNVAMPFIRYAIGDRGVAGFESCPCGRGLPLLKKVVGRQLDIIETADGRRLPGEFFPHLMKDYDAVREFQVVQIARDLLEVKLVIGKPWTSSAKDSLRKIIQDAVGPATELRIDEVESIPLTRAGKLQVVKGLPGSAG